jgi:exopolysaccharide biosynthesis polyprenyl glycosylphosphotransferase
MESSAATQANTPTIAHAPTLAPAPLAADGRARQRSGLLARRLLAADVACAVLAAAVSGLAFGAPIEQVGVLVAACALFWPVLCFMVGLYADDDLRFWVSGVSQAPRTMVATVLFAWPVFWVGAALDGVSHHGVVTFAIVALTVFLSGVGRASVRSTLHRSAALHQRVLILGSGVVAGQLVQKLRTHIQYGLVPIGLLDDDMHPVGVPGLPWLGSLADLPRVIDEQHVDRVVIAFTRASHEDLLKCIRVCRDKGMAVDVVPRLFELLDGARALDQVGGLPLLSIGTANLGRVSQVSKRVLDVAVSSLLILALLPIFLVLVVAIKLDSPGPIFFRQRRVGRHGREFKLIKLRSMHTDADRRKAEVARHNDLSDGVMFKIHEDPRVTRVGRMLRRYSLDELPQLINVLKGDMSLVGPRPLIIPENDALTEDWHQRRSELRPGLTGPWQVSGRSENPFDEMVRLDYQYVAGWSLARDVEILLATMPAVLSGRGAY